MRLAKDGETITTLDGVERTLTSQNLVIADTHKPVAIAGVMGGEYSGIMDDTTTIVFESACFNAVSVRLTARSQGMRTDASSRYEKGLDPNNCLPAVDRACELVELLDAGDVLDGTLMDNHASSEMRRIPLDAGWINRFLDLDLTKEQMKEILTPLGCLFDGDEILVPTYRPDLEHKADIAEEIARFYGYNRIPGTKLTGASEGKYTPEQLFRAKVSRTMQALGLSEIMTYSFISPKYYDKIRMPENDPLCRSIVIKNPLGEDTSIMRTVALPSMMETLARNYNNRNASASLFELASEYIPTAPDQLPVEKITLIAGMYGEDMDYFTLKGVAEELLETLGVTGYDVESSAEEYSYHPGRCAVLTVEGKRLGVLGEVHPLCVQNYGMKGRVYSFSFDLQTLFENRRQDVSYQPLPRFPAVTRDLALVCSDKIPVLTLEKAIRRGAGPLLERIDLFDVYRGEQIESGKKSVAFSIALRSPTSTLTDEQINAALKNVMAELEREGASLRI